MKTSKKKRVFIIAGAILLALYIAFCVTDCIRLRYSPSDTKPLVTVLNYYEDGYVYYHGLGYCIKYSAPKYMGEVNGMQVYGEIGKSADFSWLGVPIWGWAW